MRLRVAAAGKRGLVDSEGAFISYGCSSIVGKSGNISYNCPVKKSIFYISMAMFEIRESPDAFTAKSAQMTGADKGSTNAGRQVAVAATFCMGPPNVGEF